MSFGEYFNAFGSLGDTFVNARDRADQRRYSEDAANLAGKQLDAYLQQQGAGVPGAVQPGGLSSLGATSTPRLPTFADASGSGGDYISNLFKRESGGNPNAKAPTSSAQGLGQFTTGTWNAVARQHPELGLTPNGRTDPDQMLKATRAFTADNEAILSRAGLPVTDATRYSLHFLGAGGGPRFVAGAISNPDAPAVNFVKPEQAAANRTIFYNRDGSPKTAGQVMGSFERSFGGSGRTQVAQAPVSVPTFGGAPAEAANPRAPMQMPGVIANPPLPPQRPVQMASAEPDAVPIPASAPQPPAMTAPIQPIQLPPEAGGVAPAPVAAPPPIPLAAPVAAAQPQAAPSNPADMPVPNAQPAGFQIPPGPQAQAQAQAAEAPFVPGTVAAPAVQSGRGQDLPSVSGAPRFSPQQAQFLRAQLANPLTRAQAIQTIQGLGAPEKWETKELGGRVVQVNGRGEVRPLPGFDKPVSLKQFKGADGNDYLLNEQTGQATRLVQGKDEGYTTLITPEQRAQYGVDPSYKGVVQVGPGQQLHFPGKASTEVNVNQTAEKAQDSKIGGAYGDTFNELQSGGRAASGQLNTLRLMEKLIDTPNFYSGPGSATYLAAQRAASALGIKDANAAAPNELFAKLATQSVVDKLGGSLGAGVSNADVSFINRTVSNLENSPEGNRQIIQFGKALAQRQIEVAKLARQYAGTHGGRLDAGFDDELANWAEKNPLGLEMTPAQKRQQEQAARAPQGGTQRAPAAAPSVAPPSSAVDYLRANPNLRDAFDAKYGRGAADQILNGGRGAGGVL